MLPLPTVALRIGAARPRTSFIYDVYPRSRGASIVYCDCTSLLQMRLKKRDKPRVSNAVVLKLTSGRTVYLPVRGQSPRRKTQYGAYDGFTYERDQQGPQIARAFTESTGKRATYFKELGGAISASMCDYKVVNDELVKTTGWRKSV